MTYPNDVYDKTRRGGKMTDADKAKVVMGGILAVNVIFTVMTAQFWNTLNIPLFIIIVVQLVLYVVICFQIFRFMVYREQDRDPEESDLFLPYYKLRAGAITIKSPVGTYDSFEMTNSAHVSFICLKFGRNTDARAAATEEFLNTIQDMLHTKRLYYEIIPKKEDFSSSDEANTMMEFANSVTSPRLRATMLAIYNETLTFADHHGSVMCLYLKVVASNTFLKDELEDAMVQIVTQYKKYEYEFAFRSYEFLSHAAVLDFFQSFYGLGAIDLALSKVQLQATDSEVLKSIRIYRIISKTGRSFKYDDFDKIQTSVKYL